MARAQGLTVASGRTPRIETSTSWTPALPAHHQWDSLPSPPEPDQGKPPPPWLSARRSPSNTATGCRNATCASAKAISFDVTASPASTFAWTSACHLSKGLELLHGTSKRLASSVERPSFPPSPSLSTTRRCWLRRRSRSATCSKSYLKAIPPYSQGACPL